MATTQMLTSDPQAVELWEKIAWLQTMQKTYIGDLADNGAFYHVEKFNGKDAVGDHLNIDYIGRITGAPFGEGESVDGNEQALDIKNFQMVVNETRQAVKFPDRGIEPQRTNIKFERVVRDLIPQRAGELVQSSFFNQVTGSNPTSFTSTTDGVTYATTSHKLHVQGHNTPVAPSTNRITRAGSSVTTDEGLGSTDVFNYGLLDTVLEKNDISLQPIMALDDGYLRLYIDPYSFTNLKRDVTSPIQWGNVALSQIQAGHRDNLLEDRFMDSASRMVHCGIYQNVKIFSCKDVPYGQNSSSSAVITTTRRCVLIGKNAVAYGSPYGGKATDNTVPLKIIEQLSDYGKQKGVGFELLYGLKKVIATGGASTPEDVGTHVISVYSAAH